MKDVDSSQHQNADDFDPRAAIKEVSDRLDRPDRFARVFSNALEESRELDAVLKKAIRDMVKTDIDLRADLTEIARNVIKEERRDSLLKMGYAVWTAIIFVSGVVVTSLLNKFLG